MALATRLAQLAGAEPAARGACVLAVIAAEDSALPGGAWTVLGIAEPEQARALRWRVEHTGAHWLGAVTPRAALRCALGLELARLRPHAGRLACHLYGSDRAS